VDTANQEKEEIGTRERVRARVSICLWNNYSASDRRNESKQSTTVDRKRASSRKTKGRQMMDRRRRKKDYCSKGTHCIPVYKSKIPGKGRPMRKRKQKKKARA
jgi:hypothetical protein